jgi:hypothetical protein
MNLYPCFAENQGDATLEVLEIDEKAETVKIKNAGQIRVLSFDKDGIKTAAIPNMPQPAMPGALPAMPGAMPGIVPRTVPGVTLIPGAPTMIPAAPSMAPIARPGIITGVPAPGIQAPAANVVVGTTAGGQYPIPTRSVRALPATSQAQTAEQSVLMVEIQRELNKEKIAAGELPPLPPTELSEPTPTPTQTPTTPPVPTPIPIQTTIRRTR